MSTGFVGYILLPDVPHNPTQTELCCLIEAVNAHSDTIAAEALGISSQTLRNHLTRLYRNIGALSKAHAVALLWPVIGDELLPTRRRETPVSGYRDRRLGVERRLRTSGPDPRLSLGASVPASSPIARVA